MVCQLFDSYPDLENYMTSLLSRSESGITDGGIFTIGALDIPSELMWLN